MTNVDSQRVKEIRDNTRAMAEAFGSIADTLAEALELYVSTKTETQNSNSTPQTDCDGCQHYADEYTADVCYECKRSYTDCYVPQTERRASDALQNR